jgi:hypothetical protein
MIHTACDILSQDWQKHNVENKFVVKTDVIYIKTITGGQFRMKVLIESQLDNNENKNCIFYVRQSIINDAIVGHTKDLKLIVQDFCRSVMGDILEQGLTKSRENAIMEHRERTNTIDATYPLKKDESYEII